MSSEKIQFKPDELISFFIISDPPDNYPEFAPVFSQQCQEPLDQSRFINNWKTKQQYHRPYNKFQPLTGTSSASLGNQNLNNENKNTPIQNMSSTPLNTQATNFQPTVLPSQNNPTTFQPINSQKTNFLRGVAQQPTFQPAYQQTSFQPMAQQTTNFQPNNFQPVMPQATGFQSVMTQQMNFQPVYPQATNFQPEMPQVTGFQPVIPQATGFQPIMTQPMGFQPGFPQTTSFQPEVPQVTGFQPVIPQSGNYQPEMPQATAFQPAINPVYTQPTGFQPVNSTNTNYQPETFQPVVNQIQTQPQQETNNNNQFHYSPQTTTELPNTQSNNQQNDTQTENNQPETEQQEQQEEKKSEYPEFIYFKPEQDESFQSVIDTQKDAKDKEEETKKKEIETQKQLQEEEEKRILQDNWANNQSNRNSHPDSMETIISDQKVISSNEAKEQQQQQQLQEKKKQSPITSWADSNNRSSSSKSDFNDIIANEEKSKPTNQSSKQIPKANKGKAVTMSFQELQRQMNKPTGWGNQAMNSQAPSMSEILSSETKEAQSTKAPTAGKGKKGKKGKKEVFDFQDFHRITDAQEQARKEEIWASAASGKMKKGLPVVSTEAIIESEKNRANFPPPAPAPVTKRPNHRGRNKEVINNEIKTVTPNKWTYDDDYDEDVYDSIRPQIRSKPGLKTSFDSISNEEKSKQNKQSINTTTSATKNPQTAPTGKKNKPKRQVIDLSSKEEPKSSAWGNVSSNSAKGTAASKPKINFNQIEETEKVEQPPKPVSTGPAVLPKKKRPGKKSYLDEHLFHIQTYPEPHPRRYDSSSDDDDFYNGPSQSSYSKVGKNKGPSFNDLYKKESESRKKKPQEVHISSFAASPKLESGIQSKKQNFDELYNQELNKSNSKPNPLSSQSRPISNPSKGAAKNFDQILSNETAFNDAHDEDVNNVEIVDDIDFRITKKGSKQPQKVTNSAQDKTKKGQRNKVDNSLFWGKASKDDDYQYDDDGQEFDDDYDDEFSNFGGNRKPKDKRAEFLQRLIENKTGDGDYYEFAENIMNKPKADMIRMLMSLGIEDDDARKIYITFNNKK